jgi:hypothetical protein
MKYDLIIIEPVARKSFLDAYHRRCHTLFNSLDQLITGILDNEFESVAAIVIRTTTATAVIAPLATALLVPPLSSERFPSSLVAETSRVG